jgi:hypothetical protein
LTKTRIEKLWDKIDELKAALGGNPHLDIEKARNLLKEVEQLVIAMRLREVKYAHKR